MNQKKIGYLIVLAGFTAAVIVELFVFVYPLRIESVANLNDIDKFCNCKSLSVSSRIANGTSVGEKDLRWLGALYFNISVVDKFVIILGCTSNIISPSWQISAAHCFMYSPNYDIFESSGNKSVIWSSAGHPQHNITAAIFMPEYNRQVDRKKIFIHPSYSKFVNQLSKVDYQNLKDKRAFNRQYFAANDIAIFKTVSPFELGDSIMPACLLKGNIDKFDNLIVAGYGMTRLFKNVEAEYGKVQKFKNNQIVIKGPMSNQLLLTHLEQIDINYINQTYANLNISMDDLRDANIIWAKSKLGTYLQHEDFGSGLMSLIGDKLFVAGITSGKALIPGLSDFARINKVLDWINLTIDEDGCMIGGQFSKNAYSFTVFFIIFIFKSNSLKNAKL